MPAPLVCVTVTAPTMAELCRRRDEVAGADVVELRLDSVRDPDVRGALAGRRQPVIITCRPIWEGGHFTGPEEVRRRLLSDALDLGAEYVDIEWRARFRDLVSRSAGKRTVLSYHDFDGVPADLDGLLSSMRSTGAQFVKLAARTVRLADCVRLLEAGVRAASRDGLILIGMGDCGLATRVLAHRFGSAWTYAGAEKHVGQLPIDMLLDDYRFRSLGEATELYGVVGRPVAHSVSPAMHNAAFRAIGRDAVYLPLPAESADDFLVFARALGIKGASVTIPHKVTLLEAMHDLSDVARRVGAVNTIHVVGDRWIGDNTDVEGFLSPLLERVPLSTLTRSRVAILGSGGAARAVAIALAGKGAHVSVHARNRKSAEEIARLASGETGPARPSRGSWDLLINCTPVGMHPDVDESPLDAADLTGRYVYDLVYNPTMTRLLRDAEAAGCQTIGGLAMLVAQAGAQFRRWTGSEPPSGVMREAALERLAEFKHNEHHVV